MNGGFKFGGVPKEANLQNNKGYLPEYRNLPTAKLAAIFEDTTNSYKYLCFIALLNLIEEKYFDQNVFIVDEIYTEMLTTAWYPHSYFRLNFGSSDKIGILLDKLGGTDYSPNIITKKSREELRKTLKKYTKEIAGTLDRYVIFRLLRIFFKEQLRGIKDHLVNSRIKDIAANNLEKFWPIYYISDDESEIIIPPIWMNYIANNISILKSFAAWKWLSYMQKRNLTVPNLYLKLFPPQKRESLNFQTNLWKKILTKEYFYCIYSGKQIDNDNFSLDHFFPWSYFAHDELYNLTPTSRSINSVKSNSLPDLNSYLDPLIDQQLKIIQIGKLVSSKNNWSRMRDSYINALQIKEESTLLKKNKLSTILETHFKVNLQIAENRGFNTNWRNPE